VGGGGCIVQMPVASAPNGSDSNTHQLMNFDHRNDGGDNQNEY
jgi:hypothetical protein